MKMEEGRKQEAASLYKNLARSYIGESFAADSLRPLRRELRRSLRLIRRAYEQAVRRGKSPFDEWLGDNYHLLNREGEALLRDLRFADRQPAVNRRPALFRLFVDLIEQQGAPDEAEIDGAVAAADKVRPLTVFELSQLPLCLKAALVATAARACRETAADPETAQRLMEAAVEGLRRTAEMDFGDLTERYSIVERILREDPDGTYPRMDESSREEYRRRVALAALEEEKSEAAVAAELVEKAKKETSPRKRHVGAHLPADDRMRRRRGRAELLTQALLPLAVSIALAALSGRPWLLLLFYLPLWELLRPVVEWVFLKGLAPRRLPRLELKGVVPEEGRTLITVSTLLPAADKAAAAAIKLARLYNTNGRGAVQICLLADLKQAMYPEMPQDRSDIAAMSREIARLNKAAGEVFVLAVRPREYSPTMKAYTGRERKRGALEQLARYIRDGDNRFLALEGDLAALRRTKYILALDSDTGMRMDTAAGLVGTALHPCNRPVVAQVGGKKRVVAGHGVLTPRIGLERESAARTPFSHTMAGLGGITPYDAAAGDLYMDCFSSAVYAGKGLLEVESLLEVTDGAFPAEQVLSHDILEGCLLQAGYVSDVEMTDGFPPSMGAWLDRLHRWIRGDWQNMPFAFSGRLPLRRLDRWKLLDNLRRSLTPAAALACLLAAPFVPAGGRTLTLLGIFSTLSGPLLAALLSLIHGGWLTLTARYYSRVMPRALEALSQALYTFVMLPATAMTGLSAAGRALWRLRSRRNLLEWVTAADAERKKNGWLSAFRRFWPSLATAGVLIVWGGGLSRLCGLFFAALIPLSVYSVKDYDRKRRVLAPAGRERVGGYAAAAFRYYEETCTAEEHYLPPDNLQESPVWRVAHRTSPTNIGLYLLCVLAAADFGLIDHEGLLLRIDRTLSTVETLEKWKGNLLNWYDTRSLRPLSPRYVSTVDSGNLACCLVALRQGLLESDDIRAATLAERVRRLYAAMELSPLYNERRGLFHIGLDPDTGVCSPSYYDLLMSESRMTGYFAVATRAVPKKHWGALGRTLARSGNYVGPVSWTGTMFEYFMPRLLLPAWEGTMGYEALRFCLHCQRVRPPRGVPWGISESGFYAFDANLNYQYKAHGVPKLGLKRGLAADLVISPYSTFLTLTTDPEAALRNLARLEKLGMTGRCGFYEAADFTRGRAARGGYSIVRSYMAHHVGMSMVACANAAFDDRFVRRFLRDPDMARAVELLNEKAPVGGAVFEAVPDKTVPQLPGRSRPETEEYQTINPRTPRLQLLSGGEWMLAVTDTGAGVSCCRGLDVHMRSEDLLRRPQGIFTLVDAGEGAFSVTRAPDYHEDDCRRRVEFGNGYAAFFAEKGQVEAGLRLLVHPRLPCEERQLVLKNKSAHKLAAEVLFYFEPCLARKEDAQAHPAFSRLFLSVRRDPATKLLFITRRQREGEAPMCLAAGFLEGEDFRYEAGREALLTRPLGLESLPQGMEKPFSDEGDGTPDAVAAIRLTLELPARSQRALTFVLAAAPTETEAASRIIEARREGPMTPGKAAPSPFGGVEAQLAAQILPDLFYPPRMSREWAAAARENQRGREALWALGISGDDPILLIEVHNAADASRAEPYMRLHRSLRMGGVLTELAVVYREDGSYQAPVLDALRAVARDARCDNMLNKRGGIHPVNLAIHGEEALRLLTAVCAHNGARDLKRAGVPVTDYQPMRIHPCAPPEIAPEAEGGRLAVRGGLFDRNGFTVTERPRLPWCHILANPVFGTMVSDQALGFTWAVNSRENKLTPWLNDVASDNRGEMLLLRAAGRVTDLIWGSRAVYGDGFARYEGCAGEVAATVTVRVPEKGMWKRVEAELENRGEETLDMQLAYYTEPVLGVNRGAARFTKARWQEGALYLHNPFAAVGGSMVLTALGGADGCDCDRGGFLGGVWGGGTLAPVPDPCAAVIVRRKLPPRRKERVTFVLGFAAREEAAARLPALAEGSGETRRIWPRLHTPDKPLNALCNGWLPHQILSSRIFGRTGFYQCGGAWGFRDQLQDSLAALWLDPAVTRRQIQRCAAVQFQEGDVLHWWHRLPKSLRGVRTRCSDDLVWLPYVTALYVEFTGDGEILDLPVSWLTGEPLRNEEQERYFEPGRTQERAPVYQHCLRALERACTQGEHGLPLMGSGDWNDGMNKVGARGRGESVWLAMFLSMALDAFAPLCSGRGDPEQGRRLRERAADYRRAAEACFEGERYLRAYLDDGTPLGRKGEEACALDGIVQSFAVFCGLPEEQTAAALETAMKTLVDREHGVVKLFDPPFTRTDPRVGYITAYPGGVRENGGQYTHGAVWLAMALLESGRVEEGVQVLELLNPAAKYTGPLGNLYGGEPYALAGDVYAHPACTGRVGWSQYTGSAGWFYTAVMGSLLGLRPRGDRLLLRPRLPDGWPGWELEIRLQDTALSIAVGRGGRGLLVDGEPAESVPLDGRPHRVELDVEAV